MDPMFMEKNGRGELGGIRAMERELLQSLASEYALEAAVAVESKLRDEAAPL